MEFIETQPTKIRKLISYKKEPKTFFENVKEFMKYKDEGLFLSKNSKYILSNEFFRNVKNNDSNPRFEQILNKQYAMNRNEYNQLISFMNNTSYNSMSYEESTFILKNNNFLEITLFKYKCVYNEIVLNNFNNNYIPYYFTDDIIQYIENEYIIFYFNKENKSVKYKHVSAKFILHALLCR